MYVIADGASKDECSHSMVSGVAPNLPMTTSSRLGRKSTQDIGIIISGYMYQANGKEIGLLHGGTSIVSERPLITRMARVDREKSAIIGICQECLLWLILSLSAPY